MAEEVTIPNPHAEAAKALLDKIRALRAEVPRFQPAVPEGKRKLISAASVPDAFMESASVSMDVSKRLKDSSELDATTLRDAYAYAIAYDAIVKELFAFGRSVAHTIRVERAKAGDCALDIYAAARRISKRKDGAELIPHVEDMRRKLKRGRKKATSQPAPDPTAPGGADKKQV